MRFFARYTGSVFGLSWSFFPFAPLLCVCAHRKNSARPMSTLLHRRCHPAHPSRSNQCPYIIGMLERAFERCIISQEFNKCIGHYYWKSDVLEQIPWNSEVAKNEYIHLLHASLPPQHHAAPYSPANRHTHARIIHASLANFVSTLNQHNELPLSEHQQKPVASVYWPLPLASPSSQLYRRHSVRRALDG